MSQIIQYDTTTVLGDIETLTGNAGGAVGPDGAGNVNILGSGSMTVTGNPATNTLTITTTGGGIPWTEVVVMGPTAMAINNGYIANNAGLVSLLLPAVAALGSIIRVTGKGAGGWRVTQNAGQQIFVPGGSTTIGIGGSLSSTLTSDGLELVCITANTTWNVLSVMGNVTVV